MAMEKYELLLELKELYSEDDQCSNSCMKCDMAQECETLNGLLDKLFSTKEKKD